MAVLGNKKIKELVGNVVSTTYSYVTKRIYCIGCR